MLITLTIILFASANSPNDKAKSSKHHILHDIVTGGFNTRIAWVQGEHQQAIQGRDNQIKVFNMRI